MSNEKKIEERLDALEQQLDSIAKRLATMEISQTPYQPNTPLQTIRVNNCALCGLELKGVMGYCCPQPNCPTGLGPVVC